MPYATLHYGVHDSQLIEKLSYEKGAATPSVTLHWSPGEMVQFSMTIDWEVILECARMYQAGAFGADETLPFHTAPVSRHELNESIKTLRRARDAVFEADA